MKVNSKPMVMEDDDVLGTGITDTEGVFKVWYELAATGVRHSAIFTLYNNGGTPTTVLTAGNGTYFTITVTTDAKLNVYWLTDQLTIENKLGTTETIFVEKV